MSDLKARVGEPITAGKWNRVVDRLESTTAGFGAGGFSVSRVVCQIKNASGANRDIGELLAIDAFDGPDGSNIYETASNIVYSCVNPVWHTSISRLVILAEPIPDKGYGWAVLSGQCVVKLSSGASTDQYAMIDPESVNECIGATAGIGRLLCKFDEGDFGVMCFRDSADLWRYQLTDDWNAEGTSAKLLPLDTSDEIGVITLTDKAQLMDDQVEGDIGYCLMIANEFHAVQAACS